MIPTPSSESINWLTIINYHQLSMVPFNWLYYKKKVKQLNQNKLSRVNHNQPKKIRLNQLHLNWLIIEYLKNEEDEKVKD